MLRRMIDGVLLAALVWLVVNRFDAGELALGVGLAAVFLFSAWRIRKLWRKYQAVMAELAAAEAALASTDMQERERAQEILNMHRVSRASDLTLWTGFVLGTGIAGPALGPFGAGGADAGSWSGDMGSGFGGGGDFGSGGDMGGMDGGGAGM